MPHSVYILRTSRNTLYVGQTNNLEKRLKIHQNKTRAAAKYTRAFGPVELVYKEEYPTLSEALKREYELKQWMKKKKEALIAGLQASSTEVV